MGVASCRSIFLFSDVVFNRASVSPRFGFRFAFGFRSVVVCVLWASVPARDPTRPSPARLGVPPARPWRPTPPCAPSLSLSHLIFPRNNSLSLSSTSLSHLFALGDPVTIFAGFWIPRWAPPPLSLPPLSLPCVSPCFFHPPRACPCAAVPTPSVRDPLAPTRRGRPGPLGARLRAPRGGWIGDPVKT
jgi:hypothetical protein